MHLLNFIVLASPMLAMAATKRAGPPSSFSLYAYGKEIGGLQLFNSDGYAYLGSPDSFNNSNAAPVVFSPGNNNTWFGAPNTTASGSTPNWSNVTLFVPGPRALDSRVGFVQGGNSSADIVTSGFVFYGSTAMSKGGDGLRTLWTALSVGDGVHELYWNDTSSAQVPVTLRHIAPSNPSDVVE